MNHDVPYDFTAGWISVSPPNTGIEALNQRQFNPNRKDAKLCLSLSIYIFFVIFPSQLPCRTDFPMLHLMTPGDTREIIHEKATCSTGRTAVSQLHLQSKLG